jgi:hypothetical protein
VVAKVKSVTAGAGVPTGSVDFFIDGGWYWNAPLDATGRAVLPLSFIYPAYYPGTYKITASYAGDATFAPSTSAAITQTLVGISTPPVTTVTSNAKGQPTFSPTSFTMSSANPVGCNVTITNASSVPIRLTYGTPGTWKVLPGSGIAPGASGGVGVGLANSPAISAQSEPRTTFASIACDAGTGAPLALGGAPVRPQLVWLTGGMCVWIRSGPGPRRFVILAVPGGLGRDADPANADASVPAPETRKLERAMFAAKVTLSSHLESVAACPPPRILLHTSTNELLTGYVRGTP